MTSSRKNRAAVRRRPVVDSNEPASTEGRIRRFLTGETTGQDALEALYGHVLDEPVPQRLADLLRK
jgi:hypothetical protein